MKFLVIFLLANCLQARAKPNPQTVTLSVKDAALGDVFKQIKIQTGYNFSYETKLFYEQAKVSLHLQNEPLDKALAICLRDQPVTWFIAGKTIVLINPVAAASVLAELPSPVTGIVKNENGEPVSNASIVVKGTSIGTKSLENGEFSLDVPSGKGTLLITSIGYETAEVKVSSARVEIILRSKSIATDEVVVVGYGRQRKSDLTGSVTSLRAGDFNKGGTNTSLAQLIQGRAAGVQVTQSNSAPGGGVSIRIRGAGSINAGNEPLYVIDGFPISNAPPVTANGVGFFGNPPPTNPLNSLNPTDIESIEILKDASATAIYGSRGANGVVLITTKKGKDGRLNTEYTITGSRSSVLHELDLLKTSEYITVMNELAAARGAVQPFSPTQIATIGAGTNWQDVIFRNPYTQDHNLSFSGGNNRTSFYASLNYNNQSGILTNTGFRRYQTRINLEHKASDKFKLGVNFNTSLTTDQQVPVSNNTINQDADVISSTLVIPPIFQVYNPDGSYVRPESGQFVSVTVDNPLAIALGTTANSKNNRTFGNMYGEYTLLPGLSARVTLGADRSNTRTDVYKSTITQRGNSYNGGASILTGELTTTLLEGLLNYQKTLGRHNVSAVAGYTFQQFDVRRFSGSVRGFPSDLTGTNSLQLGDNNLDDVSSLSTTRRLRSYLGRVNYSFDSKYLLTLSFRADGSSNFGKNHPYGYFPSFAGAWRIKQESFLRNNGLFSDLKLRVGYGQIGNDDIGIGNTFATYASGGLVNFATTQVTTVGPTRIPNPDLKWETTEQYNMGLDFGFLGGRLTATADYFIKNTKDLLIDLPIPISTGYGSITTNIGSIRNTGAELTLNSVNFRGKFGWKTSFNIATLKNEVVSTGPVPSIISTLYATTAIARPGDPLFAYYGYQAENIFQTAEEVAKSAQKGTAVPGVPHWRDVNADGKIDGNDRVVLGTSFPDYTFGLDNSFSYGPLDVSVFIDGSQGFSLFNYAIVDALYPNDPYRNRLAEPVLNRWTPGNPTNKWPSGVDFTKYSGSSVNSYTVADASFVRIKNVLIAYRLPIKANNIVKSASLFVSGQNLKTFTKYLGYDPDVNSTSSSIVRVDRNSYPSAKTFSLGLNVKF